jgi:hypothetical protein
MTIFHRLFFSQEEPQGLRLQFDREEQHWVVKEAGSVVYLGTKEMCEKYLKFQKEK